jgi:glutamyl-Q tRNA(Asp) synthetase
LHLGHAYSALVNYKACRAVGGRFLLRMEDIDPARCRPEFEAGIKTDLAWLGIAWEEPVRRQSEHLDEYRAALARLDGMGLLYPSFMSRAEIALAAGPRRDPDGAPLYPGTDRDLDPAEAQHRIARGAPHAFRIRIDKAVALAGPLSWTEEDEGTVPAYPTIWGDFIVARKEVPTSYHLAVVVDDAAQGVTNVVRGRDLYQSTAAHVLLQKLLGPPSPRYRHHRLILDPLGRKLAKSDRDTSLRALREAGATPAGVRGMVGL